MLAGEDEVSSLPLLHPPWRELTQPGRAGLSGAAVTARIHLSTCTSAACYQRTSALTEGRSSDQLLPGQDTPPLEGRRSHTRLSTSSEGRSHVH